MSPHSSKSTRTTKRSLANAEPTLPTRVRLSRRAVSGVQTSTSTTPGAGNSLKQSTISKTNGSSPSGKINTSLRSYDRRDPFGAIETLIKLLTSLPSRVIASGGSGGRQYKLLSPEEHSLSMHLCNIIEPFILSYLSRDDGPRLPLNNSIKVNSSLLIPRPKFLLMRQPTEILDRIISFIDAREDLMAFGLSCSRVSEIVFPRHWEYRVVRAKISMIGVWKHLYERTDLAANVRIVEVMDERSDRCVLVPRFCRKTLVVGSPSGAGQSSKGRGGGVKQFESVISATSTEDDACSSSANEGGSIDHTQKGSGSGGGTALRRVLHKRQEKYFVAALAKCTRLVKINWEANHSPLSFFDDGNIWRTLVEKCGGSLDSFAVLDNLAFSPIDDEEDAGGSKNQAALRKSALVNLRSITVQAPQMAYGTPRTPSLARIALVLHQCPNIQNLEIRFKSSHTLMPNANEFLAYGRWTHLTSLTLTHLSCFTTTTVTTTSSTSQLLDTSSEPATLAVSTVVVQQSPLQDFLAAHSNLESLKILDVGPSPQLRRLRATPRNMLPKLCELYANRDVINMILRGECDEPRPLKIIKGFKLIGAGCNSGSLSITERCITSGGLPHTPDVNLEFYKNLKKAGVNVERVEAEGWSDLDDIRMLATCVPALTWLDVGRRLRSTSTRNNSTSASSGFVGKSQSQAHIPVTNMVEWAEALSRFEELTTFHGVKFFYEISSNALPNSHITNDTSISGSSSANYIPPIISTDTAILMTDRSRIRKNDEIASVLAWKCAKLRRVDHWEGSPGANGGKIIVLIRDSDRPGVEGNAKVRWDVRRVRA